MKKFRFFFAFLASALILLGCKPENIENEKQDPDPQPQPEKYAEELATLAANLMHAQETCNYAQDIETDDSGDSYKLLRPLNEGSEDAVIRVEKEWGVEVDLVSNSTLIFKIGDKTYELGYEKFYTYNPALRKFAANQTMNILFIGNSLTADSVEHLPRIFKNMGINNVNIYAVYRGAFTLPRYVEIFDEPNSCSLFYCEAGHDDWDSWSLAQDDCLKDVLALKTWDVISIQEHTGGEEAWLWTATEENAIKTLVARFNKAQPEHRPTTVYLLSHAYGNVYYNNNVLWDKFDGDNNKMWETCIKYIKPLKEYIPIQTIIPCITAVQNLRTSELNWTHPLDMSRDCVHSDKGITRFCESATVFQTIFKPCLGKDISDCSYTYDKENTILGSLSTPVTAENRPIAIQAAKAAVAEPEKITRLADPKPEDENVNYTISFCDYRSQLIKGLDENNGIVTLPPMGNPPNLSWKITADCSDAWTLDENGMKVSYEKGIIDGSSSNRLKMGTGSSTTFKKVVLETTNLEGKEISYVSVGLSMATSAQKGKVSIKVGDTMIVNSQEIEVSTTSVKTTGFIYGSACNAKGNVEIVIDDLIDTKGIFYLYKVSITYKNK